jgi:hypothetical protein
MGISHESKKVTNHNSSKTRSRSSSSGTSATLVSAGFSSDVSMRPMIASFAMSGIGAAVIRALDAKSSIGLGCWAPLVGLKWWKMIKVKMRAAMEPRIPQNMRVRPAR